MAADISEFDRASKLATALGGNLLEPDDAGFDASQAVWNARFDSNPDLIALCSDAEDVKAALAFAVENDFSLSVKGGGHSYAGKSAADGGLLVDLSMMKTIDISEDTSAVTVGPGVTCRDLDAATQAHGLATPTPTVSSVGVVGAALGGGGGYLSRRFGLTLDNVTSAEVVTADGKVLRASADENADLFWAIRGGGGNFGVVTELELRLHKVGPEVLSGQVIYPFDNATEVLRSFRDFMDGAPEDLQCYPFCFRVPPIDLFSEELHGEPVIDFVICHQDPTATDAIAPLRELGDPILDAVAPTLYSVTQTAFDANLPKGQRYLSRAHDLASLSDGAIEAMVEYVPRMVGGLTAAYFDPQGGAIGRVDPTATAYAGRDARYGFHIIAGWVDAASDDEVIGWATEFHAAMGEHATGGVYVNLIAEDEDERIPAAYGPNLDRLRDLKHKYDPENLFRGNYNVAPA